MQMYIYREITLSDLSNQTLFGRVVMPLPSKGQYSLARCAQYHPPVSHVPVSFDYQVKHTQNKDFICFLTHKCLLLILIIVPLVSGAKSDK